MRNAPRVPLENRISYRCLSVASRITRHLAPRWKSDFGLTVTSWRVMAVIGRYEPLSAMEVAERARAEEAEIGTALARAKRRWQETVAHTKAETARLTQEIAALQPERDRLAARMDQSLLRRYDEIRRHSQGIGLAVTDSGICSACHITLNRELMDRMVEGVDVVLCENCGRILSPSL